MSLPTELSRPLRSTVARVRVQRALDAMAIFAFAGLGLAGVVLALVKTEALSDALAVRWLIGAAALPALGALLGALRPVSAIVAAKLLDRAADNADRVTNAVSFSAMGRGEQTAFMRAAIEDARSTAARLSPKEAMPVVLPRELVGALGLALGVAALAVLEVPRFVEERLVYGGIDAVRLHEDDLDAYESELRDLLDDPDTSEEVRSAAREFNRLVEDLADERLDRAESLRRIAELERELTEARPADADLMRDALEELGEDLRRSPIADELSEALRDGDADRAESEMRQLAERLRQDPPSRAEMERLRRALERAAQAREQNEQELERREQEMQRLLRRQQEQKQAQAPQQRRLLNRRRRELDRLRREHQQQAERNRQLERLRRELGQSAENLQQREREQAADDLERGAEDLNRMAREQMSEQEMQQLQQQLSELRELIRRQREQQGNQGNQGQQRQGQQGQGQSQMDRFVLRARGQGGEDGPQLRMPGQQGQQGQGQGQGQGQEGQQGQGQPGQPGQGGQQGAQGQGGQQGQGQGQGQQTLTLGGNGQGNAILEIPGMGGSQQSSGPGSGPPSTGPGAGVGHDPAMLDDPTRLGGTRENVRVEGEHRDGPTRSEVILGSAQRGFANREYQDVYTDYSSHAEEVLERDQVPPGYRFYVRRYFQLIRPRDNR